MTEKPLPVHYYLRVYERSFLSEPVLHFESEAPFGTFSAGDYLDPKGFFVGEHYPFEHTNNWLKITAVVHRLWQAQEARINHQIGLCVEQVARLDEPHPPQWTSC